MTSSGLALVDTSVAIPFVTEDHDQHRLVASRLGSRRLGLAGHAAFETLSVLTRLPAPARRDPAAVTRLFAASFPETCFLPERASRALLARLPELGIGGGSVYDALVGAAAAHHHLELWTRDQRAGNVYRALGVDVRLIA